MTTVTIITPTTGKESLKKLVQSIDNQKGNFDIHHLLLWDDVMDKNAEPPDSFNSKNRFSVICPSGTGKLGNAPGSLLRSVGLMLARSEFVTFADDDVWWEDDHLSLMIESLKGQLNWVSCLRRVWSPDGEMLGVDNFESVGDGSGRKVPYEMCDNNTMLFRREFGVDAARLYRETLDYNDDRLFYSYMKGVAGPRAVTNAATVNQICPLRLVTFFKDNCTRV